MRRRITRDRLDQSLSKLAAEVTDPRVGLYGPDTLAWHVTREAALFLGAGRAALLQLAHPYVAYAVADHSVTLTDPLARFRSTFRRIFRMTFGDLEEATTAARTVHGVHERICGTIREAAGPFEAGHTYQANDVDAQVWVLATLWDTTIRVFERVVRPLSQEEKERFYAEGRRTAMLFGLEDELPATHEGFQSYVETMLESDTLTVTRPAAEIGRFILQPENLLGRVVRADYGVLTANLLPERLARGFALDRGGDRGRARSERVLDLAKATFPRLPDRLRFLPAYIDGMRRLEGHTGRDRVGEILNAVYLGRGPTSGA
ncbi:MAG: DUF2236 domain-containing protein [Polyangiaceae bacterium]|nr:DUF2236 domain-containing protein [Polyangiaceae bacterium]